MGSMNETLPAKPSLDETSRKDAMLTHDDESYGISSLPGLAAEAGQS